MTIVTPSQIKNGDTVRAFHRSDDTFDVSGVVGPNLHNGSPSIKIHPEATGILIGWLAERGYGFEVVRPAAPSAPGIYKDCDGDLWLLSSAKTWHMITENDGESVQDSDAIADEDTDPSQEYAPLTLVVAA